MGYATPAEREEPMNPFIRFLQDILGYFVEKISQTMKIIIIGAITLVVFLIWGFNGVLNALAIVLWVTSIFMFFILFYSIIKDRNKTGK